MHLISLQFFSFTAAFFAVFFLLDGKRQKYLLLLASYAFVCFAGVSMAAILFASTVINYYLSIQISRYHRDNRRFLAIAVCFNVAVLGLFKYFNFFSENLASAASAVGFHYAPYSMSLIAPLGLSFYTFQIISHHVDLSREEVDHPSFLDFAVYTSFWPKFIAGPIIRSKAFLPQLRRARKFKWPNIFLGAELVVYGLFLKVVLSDNLLSQVDRVFAYPKSYDGANALVSSIFFTFQIYGDFAGYSLIVIGLARALGFSVRQNFKRPNLARSFSDFWSRWHISLSTWLEDYVFRSLVPRNPVGQGGTWTSVTEMFSTVLRRTVQPLDTFESLAGDSLSYVEVAMGLEDLLGHLPNAWERTPVRDLEAARPLKGASLA